MSGVSDTVFVRGQEDWLGLKELDDAGRLVFAEVPGQHMHFTLDLFESDVIQPYLSNPVTSVVA